MSRVVLALWAVLLALAAPAAPARAHAALVAAEPADGQMLAAAPATVRLRFNEPVSPLVLRLIDAAGGVREGLPARARDELVEIDLPSGLAHGSYLLSYRVVSADGHPIGGTVSFAIGHATTEPRARRDEGDGVVRAFLWAARLVLSLGLFAGAGGAFFLAWMAPDVALGAARSAIRWTIAFGLLAAVASMGLQGLDVLALPLGSLGTVAPWRTGFGTSYGVTVTVAAGTLLAAGLSLTASSHAARALAAAALAGSGIALAASGHAGSAGPWWLTRPAVLIHGVAVAYWIGAFIPLAALVREGHPLAIAIVRSWSAGAIAAVAALSATGFALALVEIPGLAGLETAYGSVLLAKLALVAGLLTLAGINRSRLTPALEACEAGAGRRLTASIGVEIALALAILGVVGLWRFTPPPRAATVAEAPAAEAPALHLHGDKAAVDVSFAPAGAGPRRVSIAVIALRAEPLEPKEVWLALANRSAGIEPIERRAVRSGPASWVVDDLAIPAGRWQLRIDLLVSDFEKVILEGEVDLER